jgi:hypothetical protein
MTIFPLGISRFPEFIELYFLRWKRHFPGAKLENLSDQSLQDIGLDAVKPFWMP